jgi:hypothetical protein
MSSYRNSSDVNADIGKIVLHIFDLSFAVFRVCISIFDRSCQGTFVPEEHMTIARSFNCGYVQYGITSQRDV